jgi:hypothetical protein
MVDKLSFKYEHIVPPTIEIKASLHARGLFLKE